MKRRVQGRRGCSRRHVLLTTGGALTAPMWWGCASSGGRVFAPGLTDETRIRPAGPASRYTPTLQVAFVRRKGEYGMRWPGAVYDGEAALKTYRQEIETTAKRLGMKVEIRPLPIYSPEEADQWVAQARERKPDGLLVVLLDRQEHSWPTATKAAEAGIPTVIFAPLGAAFTTNTVKLADRQGLCICSTSDFTESAYGMKMISAGARLREMRFIVLRGKARRDIELAHVGTKLRYVPAQAFLEEYRRTPTSDAIVAIAREYQRNAIHVHGCSFEDVCNGVKGCKVAQTILEREDGDGITMDCLGALGKSDVSLPCIAWSRMLDHGIPAACEADVGACVTHALVQFLFDRPGFQQDPVAETARQCLIGAHCSCPTRLNGVDQPPEPYRLSYHHGKRDAVPVTQWRIGQRITIADVLIPPKSETPPQMLISTGTVTENISVPPAGGCVVSVMVEVDGVPDTLDFPGFHQLFFYGDFKKELVSYCRLYGLQARVV